MRLANTIFVGLVLTLLGVEASRPRLTPAQECAMFHSLRDEDHIPCRAGGMIKNEMRNWTELAEIEFINNRWRYVVPYVIKPKFSGKSAEEWGRMSPGPKPASHRSGNRPKIFRAYFIEDPEVKFLIKI